MSPASVTAVTSGVLLTTFSSVAAKFSCDGSYWSDWLLWWFGDAIGVLMVAPVLLGQRHEAAIGLLDQIHQRLLLNRHQPPPLS